MIVFKVSDYIDTPQGCKRTDSDNSAEMLREDFLVPALMKRSENEDFTIVIDKPDDDSFNYGASFLQEAFIGLVKYNHISLYELSTIRWEHTTDTGKFYIDRIFKYINDYREHLRGEHESIRQLKTIKRKIKKNEATILELREKSSIYEQNQRKIMFCKTILPILKNIKRENEVFTIENSRVRFGKMKFERVYQDFDTILYSDNKIIISTKQGQGKRVIGYRFLNVPIFKGAYDVLERHVNNYFKFYPVSLRSDVVYDVLQNMTNQDIEEMSKHDISPLSFEQRNQYNEAIEKLLYFNFELQSFSYQVRDRYIEEMSRSKFDRMFENDSDDYVEFSNRMEEYNKEKQKHKVFVQSVVI